MNFFRLPLSVLLCALLCNCAAPYSISDPAGKLHITIPGNYNDMTGLLKVQAKQKTPLPDIIDRIPLVAFERSTSGKANLGICRIDEAFITPSQKIYGRELKLIAEGMAFNNGVELGRSIAGGVTNRGLELRMFDTKITHSDLLYSKPYTLQDYQAWIVAIKLKFTISGHTNNPMHSESVTMVIEDKKHKIDDRKFIVTECRVGGGSEMVLDNISSEMLGALQTIRLGSSAQH